MLKSIWQMVRFRSPFFTFNSRYFAIALLLFITEVLIALYVNDRIIRPYFGDVLVVILLYAAIKTFVRTPVLQTAVAVLVIAFTIEFLQWLRIVEILGLQHSSLARTIIGTSFVWEDLLAYLIGFILILVFDRQHAQ